VVLTELLQNAIDHGFPEGSAGGDVVVRSVATTATMLSITVVNDGVGLDPSFELNRATGLGLSIVRTLVTTELGGTIVMRAGTRADFEAVGITDVRDGMGTVVHLTVPIGA
jgi:two-component sensor histidine kinase